MLSQPPKCVRDLLARVMTLSGNLGGCTAGEHENGDGQTASAHLLRVELGIG
jgi:hypothetical protein